MKKRDVFTRGKYTVQRHSFECADSSAYYTIRERREFDYGTLPEAHRSELTAILRVVQLVSEDKGKA